MNNLNMKQERKIQKNLYSLTVPSFTNNLKITYLLNLKEKNNIYDVFVF